MQYCFIVEGSLFSLINQLDAAINYRFIACCLNTAQHVLGILVPVTRELERVNMLRFPTTGPTTTNSTAITTFLR